MTQTWALLRGGALTRSRASSSSQTHAVQGLRPFQQAYLLHLAPRPVGLCKTNSCPRKGHRPPITAVRSCKPHRLLLLKSRFRIVK